MFDWLGSKSVAGRSDNGFAEQIFAAFEPAASIPGSDRRLRRLASRDSSAEREVVGRPVREDHGADEAATGHRSPCAGVAGVNPVVSHHEVLAWRDGWPATALVSPPRRLNVWLDKALN